MIGNFEKTEETRTIIVKGNNSSVERWIHIFFTELAGLDDEQVKTEAIEIRRAVEAGRKGKGRQPTAAQEQEKRMCFIEESAEEAQEARERQKKFLRTREARGEEWREQEKRSEEDGEVRVPVVPDMEAGGSYLQTTYPRGVVEKFVMDEKTGRGDDGLVRGEECRC